MVSGVPNIDDTPNADRAGRAVSRFLFLFPFLSFSFLFFSFLFSCLPLTYLALVFNYALFDLFTGFKLLVFAEISMLECIAGRFWSF